MSFVGIASCLAQNATRSILLARQARQVHRWVAPTLKELRKRREKMGPEAETPRSSHTDWNYNAEIFAFGQRLSESFDTKKLQQAFTHRSFIEQHESRQVAVGIEEPELGLQDNRELISLGDQLIGKYVEAFLLTALPKLPHEGIFSIASYLTSQEKLAHISRHIGTKDIILAAEFPVTDALLADTLKAVVGALLNSSGEGRAYLFIRDFICTQLNQQDVNELWTIEQPLELLKIYCREKNMGEPEPRSIGQLGKNTLLAAHRVAIYCNKEFQGSGYGEDVNTAIDEAARDCLRKLFGTQLNMKPINFNLSLESVTRNIQRQSSKKA